MAIEEPALSTEPTAVGGHLSTEPTAEEIVGEENVVDVDDGRVSFKELTEAVQRSMQPEPGYNCSNCTFHTYLFAELQEHVAGTGHGRAPVTEPVQSPLFNIVTRMIEIPLAEEVLIAKRAELSDLYQEVLDIEAAKAAAVKSYNTSINALDERMQQIARVLKTPVSFEQVQCEWRLLPEENGRGLYRLDTGEMVDKQPLSQEDRQAELQAAQEANTAQPDAEPTEASTEQAEVPQGGTVEGQDGSQENINDRVKMGRRKKKS